MTRTIILGMTAGAAAYVLSRHDYGALPLLALFAGFVWLRAPR